MRTIAYLIGTAFTVAWLFDMGELPISVVHMSAVGTTAVVIALIGGAAAWMWGLLFFIVYDNT